MKPFSRGWGGGKTPRLKVERLPTCWRVNPPEALGTAVIRVVSMALAGPPRAAMVNPIGRAGVLLPTKRPGKRSRTLGCWRESRLPLNLTSVVALGGRVMRGSIRMGVRSAMLLLSTFNTVWFTIRGLFGMLETVLMASELN